MKETVYHKLVRDRIPDIIAAKGDTAQFSILSDDKYLEMLDDKLLEEANEYLEDGEIMELADLLEVIYAMLEVKGLTMDELEQMRKQKAAQNGGFQRKLLLEKVISY